MPSPNGREEHRGEGQAKKVRRKGQVNSSGPVGGGGFDGRPGSSSAPQGGYGASGPQNSERYTSNTERGMGSSLGKAGLAAGLAYLLLGRKSSGSSTSSASVNGSGGSGSPSGKSSGPNLSSLLRIAILVIVVILLLKACSAMNTGSGLVSQSGGYETVELNTPAPTPAPTQAPVQSTNSASGLSGLFPYAVNPAQVSTDWIQPSNSGVVQTESSGTSAVQTTAVRNKYYTPKAGDKVTVMLYMIGTDLESKYGMATNDLQEIAKAQYGDNVNVVVMAGGCKSWNNPVMKGQKGDYIFRLKSGGGVVDGVSAANLGCMTKYSNLTEFINYCTKNYPAERNILILWDHGGGSVSGYGYDELYSSAGSMSLSDLSKALKNSGTKFDIIGFDACLMATAENAIMLSDYADYMLASEESEPGIGWYYTNWLTALGSNTAVDSVQLGAKVIDDFVSTCASQCRGQDTTLSITDLAEAEATLPAAMDSFYNEAANLISNNNYTTVAKARGSAHEFAKSSKIDQCDLAHLAINMNTESGKNLANAIKSAVKYNKVGSTVTNAYGLSAYWPYKSMSTVNTAISKLADISGFGESYSRCMKTFATVQASGQAVSGGSSYSSSIGSLFGSLSDLYGSSSGYGSYSGYGSSSGYGNYSGYGSYSGYGNNYSSGYGSAMSQEDMYALLSQMFSGRSTGNVDGIRSAANGGSFITSTDLDAGNLAAYLKENQLDESQLVWKDGKISLGSDQWNLVQSCLISVFLDDGEGFIDMGLDLRTTDFNEDGTLNGSFDRYWLSVDGWSCCFVQTVTDGQTTWGYIPVLYNGNLARLCIAIDGDGIRITGIETDYSESKATDTVAKIGMYEDDNAEVEILQEGDTIILVADYYTYDQKFQAAYEISDPIVIGKNKDLDICDLEFDDSELVYARFKITDIYGQVHWTPVMG